PWPTPTGLAAELQSRPGRIVETWLAWAQEPPTESPAGLATLVTATGRQRIRHSIGWLLVHPSARRCGLGRQLVTELLAVAAERGVTDVWVETRSEWPAATSFWRACGFSEPA
ncbi:MAG: Acetyltransferase family, partial [Planctomycetota bacterium]